MVATAFLKRNKALKGIRIGIVGGGYMGKAHAVAYSSVAAVFQMELKPILEMVCATSPISAEKYRIDYGFARSTSDWRVLVSDPLVDVVIIATPQQFHRPIAEAAFKLGKPVFCEKPLGSSLEDSRAMFAAATSADVINMVGFNYIRTPASQYIRELVWGGRIGQIIWFRGEHTEDFLADAKEKASWRCRGRANGTMGDLAPHMINAARRLIGPIKSLIASVETIYNERPAGKVDNDDQAQIMCRFVNGAQGHLFFSRVATGRKMGYAYEIHGTKGAIRFDQEDQNSIELYLMEGPEAERGFRKILTGPAHPDYSSFCQGPGHGTGYQDQITIEARDFLQAVATKSNIWPTFQEGVEVARIVEAAHDSSLKRTWVDVCDY